MTTSFVSIIEDWTADSKQCFFTQQGLIFHTKPTQEIHQLFTSSIYAKADEKINER